MFIKLWRFSCGLALAGFFAVFLILPVGTVIAEGCSWKIIAELWENPVYRGGITNSFALALFTTFLVFLLALPLAILSDSYDFKGKGFWNAMILAPMILPPFVGALGFQQVFGYYGVLNTILVDCGLARVDFLGGGGKFYAVALIEALHLYPILYLNLAAALAKTFFGTAATLPGAIFSVWHNISGAIFASWINSRRKNPVQEQEKTLLNSEEKFSDFRGR